MENKVFFKKYLIVSIVFASLALVVLTVFNINEFSREKVIVNKKISSIVSEILKEYPNVEEKKILQILQSSEYDTDLFREYGLDVETDSYIQELEKERSRFTLINGIGLFILVGGLIIILFRYNLKVTKEVKMLTSLVDKINHRNYELDLESYNEDELSILKSEIYKTTLMLKESAENSRNDKLNLKNSLSDISHQLKTPLTSILIMLDAIIDDKDMDKNVRESFIKDIKREILNINFLVQSILKLSKFEANTVKFINEKVSLIDIVKAAIKNVSTLCDLKNVKIEIIGNGKNKILCDFKWQVEAVTNILKNCVEHSFEEGVISVSLDENKVYSSITIKDSGKGISTEELPHIFERFYKGKNSSSDSIGIGLALSKSIIESNNGSIQVDSVEGEGSTFVIKFFQS